MSSSGWGTPQPVHVRRDVIKSGQPLKASSAPIHRRRSQTKGTCGIDGLARAQKTAHPHPVLGTVAEMSPTASRAASPTPTTHLKKPVSAGSIPSVAAVQREWLASAMKSTADTAPSCGTGAGVLARASLALAVAPPASGVLERATFGTSTIFGAQDAVTSSIFGAQDTCHLPMHSALVKMEDMETFGWRSKTSVQTTRVRMRPPVRVPPSKMCNEGNSSNSDLTTPSHDPEVSSTPLHDREVAFSAASLGNLPSTERSCDGTSNYRRGASPCGSFDQSSSSFCATGDVSFARRGPTPYFPSDSFRKRAAALPHSFSFRPDIDGLRAVAVVAVILFHVDESWLPGGFVGVDLFFVISGYVVAGSLLGRSASTSASEYLTAFYSRRLKRLSPALVAVTCFVGLMLAMFVDPTTEALTSYFDSGMLGLVGWANNYFAALGEGSAGGESSVDRRRLSSNNYFAPPPDSVSDRPPEQISESELKLNPFLHFWSLGVEEQFYLVFPLLILGAFSQRVVESPSRPATPATSSTPSFSVLAMADMPAPEKRPAPQKVSDSRRTSLTLLLSASYSSATGSLGIFLVCGVIVGLGISAWMSMQYPQLAFYLLPSRLWELLAGAVLFDARARGAGWNWVPDDACGTCVIVHS